MTRTICVSFSRSRRIFLFLVASVLSTIAGHTLEFAVEPSDTVVQAGNSAVLDCVVKSDLSLNAVNIQWLDHDRQTLTFIGDPYRSQLTNGSLYISNVNEELDLTGNYQCMASFVNGAIVSRTAKLSIATLSDFLEEPRDLTVFAGQKAYFACRVEASPPAKIKWLKDERPLQLDELRMTVLPSGSLEIDEVSESDQGIYRCNATGLNSHRISNKASLLINVNPDQSGIKSPPLFISRPKSATVIESKNITLDCAANGNPIPIITWLKDGYSIDMADLDTRFSVVGSTTSLKITNIQEEDSGTYQCRAENKEDSIDASATIIVHVPPRFKTKPTDKTQIARQNVEFECSVYGIPEPKVQWLKNGELVNLSEYYQLLGNNLNINGLMLSDTGIFQCVASNEAGNIQASAKLKVIETVQKNRKKRPQQSNKQSQTLFSRLNPEVDPHSILTSLKSSESEENNLGNTQTAYTESQLGFSKHFIDPSLESRSSDALPSAPLDLKALVVHPRFVILSWKSPLDNSDDILAYSVYYRQENNERERVENTTKSRMEEINIKGLRPGSVYHFRIVAYNNHGSGASSEILTVKTHAEENVPSAPLNFDAYATRSDTIYVSWDVPDIPNGVITKYIVYYYEPQTLSENKVETTNLDYNIVGLSIYTEYNVYVVAENEKGPGAASEEKTVRTFSATPTEPPANVSFEATSRTINVRWEPPPLKGQNGIITGYKIRYRVQGNKGDTVTTPSNEREFLLRNLERGTLYQVKLWALNVNGTGPPTEWFDISTFAHDMDESKVPGQPYGLKLNATDTKIYLVWYPPQKENIKIRNYIIGWGKGIPDTYNQEVNATVRRFVIQDLEPNSEYVISVRANNSIGPGLPAFQTIRTTDEDPSEGLAPLVPPVGLKAQVLSPTSVILYWTDTTLSKSQYMNNNRYYKVHYYTDDQGRTGKVLNVTEQNTMINDLKPNTLYDFRVRVVKDRRESPWSMVVSNTTMPSLSAPKDLKITGWEDNAQIAELRWQPPKALDSNSNINGYVILYTTDKSKKDRDWQAQAIKGDKHSFVIRDLHPGTSYYFKIHARNNKGINGPVSSIVTFRTGNNFGTREDSRGVFNKSMLLYLIVGGCTLAVITVAVVTIVLCCRRQEVTASPDRSKKGYQKGNQNIKPPDLWIHHDQMELKGLDKNQANNDASSSGAMTLPRSTGGNEFDSHENHHTNSLDKRTYVPNAYMCGTPDDKNKRAVKPKPITLPVDSKPPREPIATATPINSTSLSQASSESTPSSRPPYPRTQYTISRAHVTLDQNAMANNQALENPYATHPPHSYEHSNSQPSSYISQPPPVAHVPPTSAYAPGMSVLAESQAGKRAQAQGHPLKSFTVPAPPPISAPGTPQPKHVVRPSSSPYKKQPSSSSSTLTGTPPSRISTANPPPHTAEEVQRLQPSHSTEELNQEMANLEGLMMTLNAITANEFEC
nr:neogenin isoform X2 [Onthophagus taurus]